MSMSIIIINKNDECYKDFIWCLKAMSRKEPYNVIQIKDGVINCTDSFRLHSVKIDVDFDNGLYSVIKNKDNIVLNPIESGKRSFPNTEPLLSDKYEKIIKENGSRKNTDQRISYFLAEYAKYSQTNYINYSYIKDALDGECIFSCKENPEDKPVKISYKNRTAIIMVCIYDIHSK